MDLGLVLVEDQGLSFSAFFKKPYVTENRLVDDRFPHLPKGIRD